VIEMLGQGFESATAVLFWYSSADASPVRALCDAAVGRPGRSQSDRSVERVNVAEEVTKQNAGRRLTLAQHFDHGAFLCRLAHDRLSEGKQVVGETVDKLIRRFGAPRVTLIHRSSRWCEAGAWKAVSLQLG